MERKHMEPGLELVLEELKILLSKIQRPKTWLSVLEAASYLGIGKSKMYKMLENREMPYSTIGDRILVKIDVLEKYMRLHEIPPNKKRQWLNSTA